MLNKTMNSHLLDAKHSTWQAREAAHEGVLLDHHLRQVDAGVFVFPRCHSNNVLRCACSAKEWASGREVSGEGKTIHDLHISNRYWLQCERRVCAAAAVLAAVWGMHSPPPRPCFMAIFPFRGRIGFFYDEGDAKWAIRVVGRNTRTEIENQGNVQGSSDPMDRIEL